MVFVYMQAQHQKMLGSVIQKSPNTSLLSAYDLHRPGPAPSTMCKVKSKSRSVSRTRRPRSRTCSRPHSHTHLYRCSCPGRTQRSRQTAALGSLITSTSDPNEPMRKRTGRDDPSVRRVPPCCDRTPTRRARRYHFKMWLVSPACTTTPPWSVCSSRRRAPSCSPSCVSG